LPNAAHAFIDPQQIRGNTNQFETIASLVEISPTVVQSPV
jgi:hypothetical protein